MYRIAKEFHFCAGHRLESAYTEPCLRWHGHNYRVQVVFRCLDLNKDGMIVDFGKIKDHVKGMINGFDHSLLVAKHSQIAEFMLPEECDTGIRVLGCNPTAENIARIFYMAVREVLHKILDEDREKSVAGYPRTVFVDSVKIWETPTSWAEYSEN